MIPGTYVTLQFSTFFEITRCLMLVYSDNVQNYLVVFEFDFLKQAMLSECMEHIHFYKYILWLLSITKYVWLIQKQQANLLKWICYSSKHQLNLFNTHFKLQQIMSNFLEVWKINAINQPFVLPASESNQHINGKFMVNTCM